MKTLRILTLPLTVLSLLSCSSSGHDAPPDPAPEPPLIGIAFGSVNDAWQDAPTTRATNAGLETLFSSFRVWGYKTTDPYLATRLTVMDGYNAQYAQSTDSWEYSGIDNPHLSAPQTIKYWDYSASSYRFFAYSPAEATVTIDEGDSSTSTFAFPYAYTDEATATSMPYASDLWLSTNAATDAPYGESVRLSFKPLVAKVRFKFTYPDGIDTVTMKDIAFRDSRFISDPTTADTPLRGTIKATYSTTGQPTDTSPQLSWTTATTNATGNIVMTTPYEAANDTIHAVDDTTQYEKWYYVPPLSIVPYEQGAYTITAIIDGNYSSATVPAYYMQWKPGHQYTYIFKITEAGSIITFAEMQVEQWLPGSNIDNNGKGTEGW